MLQVIGAGLPRTGTWSLKHALEGLLGGTCYHMRVLHNQLTDLPHWADAVAGRPVHWRSLLGSYTAAVDWPTSAFWPELSAAFPEALVVLSLREDANIWWASADQTVMEVARKAPPAGLEEWHAMYLSLLRREFGEDWHDPAVARAAYDRHVASVRDGVPAERLVEWRADEGWEPLCAALGLPVPEEPFPHLNSRADWHAGHSRRPDLAFDR